MKQDLDFVNYEDFELGSRVSDFSKYLNSRFWESRFAGEKKMRES